MRKFAPLTADHPAALDALPCAACKVPFVAGDVTALVPLGPGDSAEGRERAREGRAYNATAALVHWACATGEEN